MKPNRTVIPAFLMLISSLVLSQEPGNLRVKKIVPASDSVPLDTLSIVPGSVHIKTTAGSDLDTLYYRVDHPAAVVVLFREKIFNNRFPADTLVVSFRVFPFSLTKTALHKDKNKVRPDLTGRSDPFAYTPKKEAVDFFRSDGISKNGSISRGITFGNNQDLAVNSDLNLQLSGKITPKIDLLMVASDNNIPIQVEGNTRQLQEFDKVFIQLTEGHSRLIAGDFQLAKPTGYFMNYTKKAQGVSVSTLIGGESEKMKNYFKSSLSGAVSKGKYARYEIKSVDGRSGSLGIEGNQGPYRLRGMENEQYIIVLSGTEKVYMDGELLQRGQDADYVIDYNTAEITFTPRRPVTKDKRILVEFQYSDRNYARSLFASENEFGSERYKIRLNAYSEQDSKNQPLQQDLTSGHKQLLRLIGDTLAGALYPGYDSVGFSGDEVRYKKIDTTVLAILYKDVFVQSVSPDSAQYRVSFSFTGNGNGDYIQVQSSANGRVFRWIAPVSGQKQGNYVPEIILITPKKKQMITLGGDYLPGKNSTFNVEAAMSNNDLNTFSPFNSNDDAGYALKSSFEQMFDLTAGDTVKKIPGWKLAAGAGYEMTGKTFSPPERFRTVEFERDWNRGGQQNLSDQHILGANVGVGKGNIFNAGYKLHSFFEGSFFEALKHSLGMRLDQSGFLFSADGSYLTSLSPSANTEFIRQQSLLSKRFKWFTVGVKSLAEQNRFKNPAADTLMANSFSFYEWESFVGSPDTFKNKYQLNYKQRSDFIPGKTGFNALSFAEEIGVRAEIGKNPDHLLRAGATYRNLVYRNTGALQAVLNKPGTTLTGRAEYNMNLLKGTLFSGTFYEIGNGLESKKEFTYLEVAAGQGVYGWTDYNGNSIRELNEFELAKYSDQARYVRVYTPTNDFIKTYSSQFSQVLTLRPSVVWNGKKGVRKFLSLFSNTSAWKIDRKTTNDVYAIAYNPFLQETQDTALTLLNTSFRNTSSFNPGGSVFGFDITVQDAKNKILFINGFESRINRYEELRTRLNITRNWSIAVNARVGDKKSFSEFFSIRDFSIGYYEAEPRLSFQPSATFRISALYKYTEKKNEIQFGGQKSTLEDYGTEFRFSKAGKGSFDARADFIRVAYNETDNSSVAFEMLDGLKAGNNITWNLSWQQNLSNSLQISFTYDGRKPEGNKAIHTGGAQVRAVF